MTPAGTSNELDVQNEWKKTQQTHTKQSRMTENIMRQCFLGETVTQLYLLANSWEAKWRFIRGAREKTRDPLRAPRITEQSRHHGSAARYIHDPMTQGYRPGGGCWSCDTVPKKSPRGPEPFLVVSPYTIWTQGHNPPHISCAS